MPEIKLEVSLRSLLIFFAVVISFWLLYQIKEVIIILVFSIILMSALNPTVEKLEKRIPLVLAVIFVYLALVLVFLLLLAVVVPALLIQVGSFLRSLPLYVDKALEALKLISDAGAKHNIVIATQDVVDIITGQIATIPSNIFSLTSGVFNILVGVFMVGIFAFYLLLEHRQIKKQIIELFPEGNQERVFNLIVKVEKKLGYWLRGQASLCLIVGFLTWLGLFVLGIDFALPLAIIAGFFELIPNFGPTLAAVPAIMIALVTSPLLAVLTAIWYILVQQVENTVIVPKVMSSAVDLNPLIVLLAVLIGGKVMGVVGVLLSVPLVAVGAVFIEDYLIHRKKS